MFLFLPGMEAQGRLVRVKQRVTAWHRAAAAAAGPAMPQAVLVPKVFAA